MKAAWAPQLRHSVESACFEKIAAVLEEHRAIRTRQCGPGDLHFIRRLAGKAGLLSAMNGSDRADAIHQTRDFLATLRKIG